MRKLHNIWAVLCFLMSCLFFVAGRWSAFSEMERHVPPIHVAQGQPPLDTVCAERSVTLGEGKISGGHRGKEEDLSLPRSSGQQTAPPASSAADSIPSPPSADIPAITDGRAVGMPQQSPEIAALQAQENKALQEEMAHTLRTQGMPEEEIEAQLQASFPPLPESEAMVAEGPPSLAPEQMVEDYAAALYASGVPEEEWEQMMDNFVSSLMPQETAEP
jgi:hypothetical protein